MKDKQLLLVIMAQLERERTVSIPQLAQLLGADENSIYEALEVLVFAYDAASIRLDLHDTYAVLATTAPARLLRLTPTEADALIDALMTAGFSRDDDLVKALFETKSVLGETEQINAPRMQNVVIQDIPSTAQNIMDACEDEEHHLLQLQYCAEDDTCPHVRIVEPERVFSKDGHRYLQAFSHNANDWRMYRLDRIEDASVLEQRFEPRSNVPAIDDMFAEGKVIAHITLTSGHVMPDWSGIKKIEVAEDGAQILHVEWTGSSWLPRHIVALMGTALPLDPPELIDACMEAAHLQLYASNGALNRAK